MALNFLIIELIRLTKTRNNAMHNRRRKQLHHLIEKFRIRIVEQLVEHENSFLTDSMPLPIVRFSRAKRSRICREDYQSAPSFGYCAAHNQSYFGYKLHGVATVNGVMTHFDLFKAHVHDIEYLKDIRHYYPNCPLLGDQAYLSNPLQLELFAENCLFLITPMRRNQKNYQKQPAVFRYLRRRIETIFSQLCDQFQIQKNYAKTFRGLDIRILTKITAFTLLQYFNTYKFVPVRLIR